MKIGINMFLWTDFVDEVHFKYFEDLKKAGYDGVEIPLFCGDEKHYTKIGRELKNLGLECTATSSCLPEKDLISADFKTRAAGVNHLLWAVDMLQAMGGKMLGGPLHSCPGVFTGDFPTHKEINYAVEGLRTAGEYAAKSGISLGVEYLNRFECYLVNSVRQTKQLVEQVGLENVGIHYDTHHAHYEEYSVKDAIHSGKGMINHIQLSESNRGIPGKGQVNWNETFSAIQNINYDGWLTVEAFNREHPLLRKNLFLWRELYSSNEQVYKAGISLVEKYMPVVSV